MVKKKQQLDLLTSLSNREETLIFYETPHRIQKTLLNFKSILEPQRKIALARELTKRYESLIYGSVDEVISHLEENKQEIRGEMVLIVSPFSCKSSALITEEDKKLIRALLDELPATQVARLVAKVSGSSRGEIYNFIKNSN